MNQSLSEKGKEQPKNTEVSYKYILKFTGIFSSVQGLGLLISILRNKLAAVLLGPVGMALVAIYNSIITFISDSSNMGIKFSCVRNLSELYQENNRDKIEEYIKIIRTWSLWIALSGALLCLLLSPLISLYSFGGDLSHTGEICLLSPVVAFLAVIGGEISILKGMRVLKRVALISGLSAVIALLSTIPFFYFWSYSGILPALNVSTFLVLCIHLYYTLPLYPWKVDLFSKACFHRGKDMLKMGIPYTLAAIAGSIVTLSIPAYLLTSGSLQEVGYFKAGYGLIVTYAGMIFVAMESDYFPRLSSIHGNKQEMNRVINQQIEVCLLLISPSLVGFMLLMPVFVPLLYSSAFLPVVNMALCASFYLFFRALLLPVSYVPLAKGDSVTYLITELFYDTVVLALIIVSFSYFGLEGTGVALTLSIVLEILFVWLVYSRKYGFKYEFQVLQMALSQLVLISMTFCVCYWGSVLMKCVAGGILLLFSSGISLIKLQKKTALLSGIIKKRRLK